jgi:activator of Hsp90 ATPase-like protein
MAGRDLTYSFVVEQTPKEAFDAINNVRGWWSGNVEGITDKLGAEWTYRYEDLHYSKQKIEELVPGKKVVWLVVDSYLKFVKDQTEWNGTKIVFAISRRGDKTEVQFTHRGLVPDQECYGACSDAWGSYIKHSLRDLIVRGKGQPNPKEKKSRRGGVG